MTTASFRVVREDQSLIAKTVSALRRAILSQHFRPGDRLVERELCELTGVSRGSVREALRRLEAEGLVINQPYRGLTVAIIDKRAAEEIYQVRGALEPLAARLAAQHATEAQLEELQRSARQFGRVSRSGDATAVVESLAAFYGLLFEASGNQMAAAFARTLHVRASALRVMTYQRQTSGDAERSLKNIADIALCVAKRDPAAAEAASRKQVERSCQVAMRILDKLAVEAAAAPAVAKSAAAPARKGSSKSR